MRFYQRDVLCVQAYLALFCAILICSQAVSSSDFGTTGLIDVPTARMSDDGILKTTAAIQSRTNSYALTYQATPWFETTFRYTGFNDFFTWDRNYEVKLRLWPELQHIPQVAIGIRDLVGTGIYGSEYIVASKQFGKLDLTLGVGWGRLSGEGDFSNPFSLLSDRFDQRAEVKPGYEGTGSFQPGQWFSGERAGFFGGLNYKLSSAPISFIAEYNPDQYLWDSAQGAPKPISSLSAAIKWDIDPRLSVKLSRQHNQEWGIELSAMLDTKSSSPKPYPSIYKSSLDMVPSELPKGINQNFWYDKLLYDVERSGLLLIEATIDDTKRTATIVMGNMFYPIWMDAVESMIKLLDLHLPTKVSIFNIIIEEEGHRLNSISLRRPSLTYGKNNLLIEHDIKVYPAKPLKLIQHKTSFVQKKVVFDVNLANRVQLFDPDDPARYQIYAKIAISMMLPKNWVISGAYDRNIFSNFDQSARQSNSVLKKVRSDIIKYLTQGASGLDSLFIQKRGNVKSDVLYRVFGGVLESMYSGIGGEVLYQPFRSRVAFGASAAWVQQRDFDKSFKHLDYDVATAFASLYWATPFHNFDAAIHVGKYLAKDIGATFEVRRTFDNGWMIGAWATKTNVSSQDFGEGSFDKGLFFKIPFNGFLGTRSRSSYVTRIRPVQRDGGQYLEDFTGRIWWDVRSARYDAFSY